MRRTFPLSFLALLMAVPALAQPRTVDFSRPDDLKIAQPYAASGGVTSGVALAIENGALIFRNRAPGSFGVSFNLVPLDVDQITDLEFDFKAAPDARVNWFFKANNRYFGVHFTGPNGVRPGSTLLGDAEISDAPNGWKHAHIPLRGWLRSAMPDEKTISISEVLVGNWDNSGYLMAGIGGNGPGATWEIDNLKLEKRTENAQFGPARFEGQNLIIPARNLASFDFSGLQLHVDGFGDSKNAQRFLQPDLGLVFPVAPSASTPNVTLQDGQQVGWKLGREGANGSAIAQGEARFSYANLGKMPLPRLIFAGQELGGDMENETTAPWSGNGSTAVVSDDSTAASGERSLQLTNKITASPFALSVPADWDAAQFPALTFAYKTDDRVRVDLNFNWGDRPYSIRFTDRDNPTARVAAIGDLKTDNQWHLATVNLLESLKKVRPDATDFKLTNLQFTDSGWTGNAKGVQWWLDNWHPAPLVTGALNAQVMGRDVAGLKGVAWEWNQTPDSVPAETSKGDGNLKIDVAGQSGLWWLHVRAHNGAGKWSETAHFPFFVGPTG